MKIKILVLSLFCLFIFGCAEFITLNKEFITLNYDISLDEVERPAIAKQRYGEQKIIKTEEEGYKYVFEDEMIKILWLPTSSKIAFLLENKTDYSIRIIWDEAAYVDENNHTHRIMHSGIRYIDRDSAKPPSVVVRKGKLDDVIIPSDYVVSGTYGWREIDLFPTEKMDVDPQQFLKESKEFIGKKFQILLPIQIEDVTNDYIFTFKIDDVNLAKKNKSE
jgi:hypothetical protein